MEALRIQTTGITHDSACPFAPGKIDGECDGTSLFSGLAAIVIAVGALTLAVLPAAVALRILVLPSGGVLAALEYLGAGLLGAKFIATAWTVVGRLLEAHPTSAVYATPD
jgi:hypothetical protein